MTRQTDHGQRELNNMLVTRIVLNEMKKVGTFTQGFRASLRSKGQHVKIRRSSKLADKVNC